MERGKSLFRFFFDCYMFVWRFRGAGDVSVPGILYVMNNTEPMVVIFFDPRHLDCGRECCCGIDIPCDSYMHSGKFRKGLPGQRFTSDPPER